MQETSLLELFESAIGRPRPPERPLPEIDLDVEACPIEVAEPEPLEPTPPPPELAAFLPRRARAVTPGLLVSIGLHVMPLAGLVAWSTAAPEVTAPIPVQLVIEQPPPPPPPRETKPPAPGPLASEDVGKKTALPDTPIAKPTPPPPPPAEPPPVPAETKLAEVPPPPKPKPKPKPKLEAAAEHPAPKPAPPEPPQAHPPARAPEKLDALFSRAMRDTTIPGPAASRDEYLAYLVALTRRHIDLLPRTFVGDRRGEAALAVLVLSDGTIARIAIKESSGYPEIDQRIEQMVAAVGRFPPLPQWYQGPAMDLTLRLRFPEAIEQ